MCDIECPFCKEIFCAEIGVDGECPYCKQEYYDLYINYSSSSIDLIANPKWKLYENRTYN